MKKKRQSDLINLVSKKVIRTQEELTEGLIKLGYVVTQATVSRDIKELKLVKISDENGVLRYSKNLSLREESIGQLASMKNFIVEIKNACNIIVVKTTSGMAQGVAAAIDGLEFEDVLGTIAGDDTIMIACTDFPKTKKVSEYLIRSVKC